MSGKSQKPHRNLVAWQKGMDLVMEVYKLTQNFPERELYGLSSQLRRAALSVMSNIAEGFERGTNKEFVQFLHIAKGSVGEVRSLLYAALDVGYLTAADFKPLADSALCISRSLSSFIKYLQGRKPAPPQPDNLIT